MAHRPVPTMLGEVDGRVTPRLRQLAAVFKQAGFTVKLSPDMQTWLKTHAIMDMGIIIVAVTMTGGSAQLARSRRNVVMLVQAIREGLLALRALGTPLTPFYLTALFLWFPAGLLSSSYNLCSARVFRCLGSTLISVTTWKRYVRWHGRSWRNCAPHPSPRRR